NIVIAYSNNSVKEYNDQIREHFFPNNQDNIMPEDKIMVASNSSQNEIFLSNGDFGIVKEVSYVKEQRHIVTKSKIIDVLLSFRDVVVLFEDLKGIPHLIRCKIIENLLYSDKPSLSSDENKALYVDFVYRNPELRPHTKEFKDALKSDPYFNGLKIKFGYAITCHKAQGSEWENVLLNCATPQNYLSQSYFRWLYTAMTRTTQNLYLMNEPVFKLNVGTAISTPTQNTHQTHTENKVDIITKKIAHTFLESIYQEIHSIATANGINIINVEHNSYHELYTFEYNSEISRLKINYNGNNIITKIDPIETNILSKLLKNILENLVHKIIFLEKSHTPKEFEFNQPFLKEYFHLIQNKLHPHGIKINHIIHLNYMERYTFENNGDVAIFDFYYNGKSQFTKFQDQKDSSFPLVQQIYSLLK
ncbi:MAG: ATP-binding domain-containing protein, partial [Candidatus ainarchaeum sp.]|nr:ATP-binding domain-containing protein [Candidatus ainarchaeum sp.]